MVSVAPGGTRHGAVCLHSRECWWPQWVIVGRCEYPGPPGCRHRGHLDFCGGDDVDHPENLGRAMGLRVSNEDEQMGLDLTQHNEAGYTL